MVCSILWTIIVPLLPFWLPPVLPDSAYYGHLASHYGGHRCSPTHVIFDPVSHLQFFPPYSLGSIAVYNAEYEGINRLFYIC
jgi:hypothetical protein